MPKHCRPSPNRTYAPAAFSSTATGAIDAMQYGRTTLSKFIIEEQRQTAERDEQLTALINDIQTSCKYISTAVARGPLQATLGSNATRNAQGETQQRLDIVANDIMLRSCEWGGQ